MVNLSHVNQWFTKIPVKFETLQLLRFAPQGLHVGISLDLRLITTYVLLIPLATCSLSRLMVSAADMLVYPWDGYCHP